MEAEGELLDRREGAVGGGAGEGEGTGAGRCIKAVHDMKYGV